MSVDILSNLSEGGYSSLSAFKLKLLVELITVYRILFKSVRKSPSITNEVMNVKRTERK
jgi:hypothetical protein